jgi:hypothetical protein
MPSERNTFLVVSAAVLTAAVALADLNGSYVVPLDHPAIQYAGAVSDPVSKLQERLDRGEAKLDYRSDFGYLVSVLQNLHAPVSSQVLVFSKTSFQAARIYPKLPRALYFNDSVAVGFVRGGDVLEIATADPKQGVVFYTLDQWKSTTPQFVRRDECLQCHYNGSTLGVPGLLVRSVYPDRTGIPLYSKGTYITDHRSPLKERWGGWYVTGTHGNQTHLGNVIYDRDGPAEWDIADGSNVTDLRRHLNTESYLSPHSDIVALMVLEHQTRMQNLITRVGYETRIAVASQIAIDKELKRPGGELNDGTKHRIHAAADELAAYMLFAGEAPIESKIAGTSGFAAEFEKEGPRDHKGRSLRQFELTRRMFQYPCSYMIYSEAFDNLPDPARDRVYRRLWEVLTGKDSSPAFAHLSTADRQAIFEILSDTKRGLPDYWFAGRARSQ